MSSSHSNLFSLLYAFLFLLRWQVTVILRLVWRILRWTALEAYLGISHTRISRGLMHYRRLIKVILKQPLRIQCLRWRYRPRAGDSLLPIAALLMLIAGLDSHYDNDQFVSPETQQATQTAAFTPETVAQSGSKTLSLRLPAGQKLSEAWRSKGLLVHNSEALSEAFRVFFDARYARQSQALDIEMNFSTPNEKWHLESMAIDFSSSYRLRLVPEEDVFGTLGFEASLQDKPIRVARFALEDTVEGLLLAGGDHFQGITPDQMGKTGAPVYLESLLLFLDRSLESTGGLRSGDLISALYSLPKDGETLRLLYVRVRQADNTLEMVHFQQDVDESGSMYDDNGRAFVISNWGEPVTAGKVSSNFGMRLHPVKKYTVMHRGIDFVAPRGTPIRATQAGIVLKKKYDPNGYGNYVQLKHKDGFTTLYAHLDRFNPDVRRGYPVKKGQIIGTLGNTGLSTGAHLHYEIAHNGREIDPLIIQKAEQRLLSPTQRQNIKRILKQRREQMQELLDAG